MTKKPNVPMTNPMTTTKQKVDPKKFSEGYDRIFGKKGKRKTEKQNEA